MIFFFFAAYQKVNNVETSWALGAIFDHFHNLNIR